MIKSNDEYLAQALANLAPGAEWGTLGSEINWMDDTIDQPSEEDLASEIARIKQAEIDEEYKAKRKAEYPPISDFIDAYYWEKHGDSTLMDEYMSKVSSIKNKFPK